MNKSLIQSIKDSDLLEYCGIVSHIKRNVKTMLLNLIEDEDSSFALDEYSNEYELADIDKDVWTLYVREIDYSPNVYTVYVHPSVTHNPLQPYDEYELQLTGNPSFDNYELKEGECKEYYYVLKNSNEVFMDRL